MEQESQKVNPRWRLWVVTLVLILVAVLALMWSNTGVTEDLTATPTLVSSSAMVWRQCNPDVTPDTIPTCADPSPTLIPIPYDCACDPKQEIPENPSPTPVRSYPTTE